MATVISAITSFAAEALLEIDEMESIRLPDGRVKVVFVTSGVMPSTAKIKTLLWAVFGLPVQRIDEVTIEELQKGSIVKRYKVTVVLKPALRAISEGEGLGIIDVLINKNVKVITY